MILIHFTALHAYDAILFLKSPIKKRKRKKKHLKQNVANCRLTIPKSLMGNISLGTLPPMGQECIDPLGKLTN